MPFPSAATPVAKVAPPLVVTPDDTLYASDVNAGPHGLDVHPTTGDVYVASTVPDAPGVTKASPRRQP